MRPAVSIPRPAFRLPGFPAVHVPLPLQLAFSEIWRNKSRFAQISIVVAFITLLVLFTAGLAEGLGLGNREYLGNARGQLVVYSDKSELLIPASRITNSTLRSLRNVPGVQAAGAVAWTSVAINTGGQDWLKVQLGGVLPGEPGEPAVLQGTQLGFARANEALIDRSTQLRTGLKVGDKLAVRSTVASRDEVYELTVAGITGSEQYSLQPTVFVGSQTWERIRPRSATATDLGQTVFNVAFVELAAPEQADDVARMLGQEVDDVLVVDKKTAWENTPGYGAQQSTLGLQRAFTLVIGLIVVAGFFRIQTMQKVAQVGVLKAIGTPASSIVGAALMQIFLLNSFGVLLGVLATLGLAAVIPGQVPIRFDGASFATTTALMLLIGPLGGLVSVQILLKTEPLKALGLAS